MFRLPLRRSSSILTSNYNKITTYTSNTTNILVTRHLLFRTMATGAAKNEDLKVTKLFDVSNFVAVVTGGGTGIGLMCTQALVANGAKVYITGRRDDALQAAVEKYNTGPGSIVA